MHDGARARPSFERTFVGFPPPRDPRQELELIDEDACDREGDAEEHTSVDLAGGLIEPGERILYRNSSKQAVLTLDMVEELRRRLREAQQIEAAMPSPAVRTGRFPRAEARDPVSGVPLPEAAASGERPLSVSEDPDSADPSVEVELGCVWDSGELDEVLASLPELELALAAR